MMLWEKSSMNDKQMLKIEDLADEFFHLSRINPNSLENVKLDKFFEQFEPMTLEMRTHFMYYLLEKMNVQNYPRIYSVDNYESMSENY